MKQEQRTSSEGCASGGNRAEHARHKAGKAASLSRRRGSVARVVLQVSCVHPVHGRQQSRPCGGSGRSGAGPVTTANWAPDQSQVSRHLYLILVMLTEEAALRIVQAVHDSNGAEALRLMYRRYNPLTRGRMLARLNEVLPSAAQQLQF